MHFPTVSGRNLQRRSFEVPRDLDGALNVLLIAFQRWHQSLVDTWVPFLQQAEEKHSDLRYYELPTLQQLNPLSRVFINEGMRAGIPDPLARERTVTLYLDKEAFREALDLPNEQDIHLFLIDRQGTVLWRATGAFAPEKAAALSSAIKEHHDTERDSDNA
jgi:hypothetical protein